MDVKTVLRYAVYTLATALIFVVVPLLLVYIKAIWVGADAWR